MSGITRLAFIGLCGMVLSLARPARADLAAVYVQGNGGVTSGTVNDLPANNMSPDHGAALGARAGVQLLFGELYLDHVGFTSGASTTRYVLGVHAGGGLFGIDVYGRAGIGYLREQGGALAGGMEPMMDRHGAVARVGGGIEKGLSYGFHVGFALEAEYFAVAPYGASLTGDEGRSGKDVYGYLYLKLQLGL